jgi:hypothetical protein
MRKCQYVRCSHQIKNVVTNVIETYKHINEAKRASVAIQTANGGLGVGALRVVPHINIGR